MKKANTPAPNITPLEVAAAISRDADKEWDAAQTLADLSEQAFAAARARVERAAVSAKTARAELLKVVSKGAL